MEEKLIAYVKRAYLPERFQHPQRATIFSDKDLHFFAPAVAELSAAFTFERRALPKNYFHSKEYRSAYLLYFFLTNHAKVAHCLQQLEVAGQLPRGDSLDVLDLGSGPGTASVACAHHFSSHHHATRLTIRAIDHNHATLCDATALFTELADGRHRLETETAAIAVPSRKRTLKDSRYHLIVAANVMNELGTPKDQFRFCRDLVVDHLHDDGILIVIDPALQRTTRALMEVRDLLAAEQIKILAPCLHQSRCPMRAANKRDWCHFYVEWNCPELIRRFDRLIGNKHDYLKMAYFVFARCHPEQSEGSRSTAAPRDASLSAQHDLWRVVSSPMPSKGKTETLLCGESGALLRVSQLHKDIVRREDDLRYFKRGDLVVWPRGKARLNRGDQLERKLVWNKD